MPKYVIERNIPGAGKLSAAELKAISQKSCAVLRDLGPQVQWLHSYVTGDKVYCVYIAPDEATRKAIRNSNKDRVIASFKLCIDTRGDIASITMLKSSGFPRYDAKLQSEIGAWRYSPYQLNGAAVAVCTAVTFIYANR